MTDREADRDRRQELAEEERLDALVPAYIVIEYDVRGRENCRYSFIDVSEDEARDSFEESVECLTMGNEVECKVELWTGNIRHDYIHTDLGTHNVQFVDKDALLEVKTISWRR